MTKQKIILFIVIIGILIGIIFLISLKFPKTEKIPEEKESDEKTNQEEKEISQQEIQEYDFKVSSAAGVYPKFISGKFSKRPPEVQAGENLTISIKVEDPDGISIVKLTVVGQEEGLKKEIDLQLIEGDEFQGTWQGSLIIPIDMTQILSTNFYTKNKSGKEKNSNVKW